MTDKIIDLMHETKKRLSGRRWRHTMGVANTAAALAMRYDVSLMEKAFLSGILHDIAKEVDKKETLKRCEKAGVPIADVERRNPVLLHGKLAAVIAENEFDLHDEDLLNAIRFHTTGRTGMTMLEKILYVADFIEPMRDRDTNLEMIRSTAFLDLEKTVALTAKETLRFLTETGREIDSLTQETYDYYIGYGAEYPSAIKMENAHNTESIRELD